MDLTASLVEQTAAESGSIESMAVAIARLNFSTKDDANTTPGPTYIHKPSSTPIMNFPLPHELRDEIYGYLIDANRVSKTVPKIEMRPTAQCKGHVHNLQGAPTTVFNFELSILAVNKAISAEALSYFYGKNGFVEINYDVPYFGTVCCINRLPKVLAVEHGKAGVVPTCLTVDISWPAAPFKDAVRSPEVSFENRGSYIVLLADLPKVTDSLRYLCEQSLASSAVLVTSGRGHELALYQPKQTARVSVEVTGSDTKHHSLTQEQQEGILKDLAALTGAGYGMTISGLGDAGSRCKALLKAGPLIIWPTAFVTQKFADIRELKQKADELAKAGNLTTAESQLLFIFHLLCANAATEEIYSSSNNALTFMGSFASRSFAMQVNLMLTLADIELRMGHSSHAVYLIDGLVECIHMLTAKQLHQQQHLMCLTQVTGNKRLDSDAVDDLIANLTHFKAKAPYDYATHDLEVMLDFKAAWAGQYPIPPSAKRILNNLSIFKLPFRPYDGKCAFDDPHPNTDGLVGWQDTEHLVAFTEEDKLAVKAFQKKADLAVSDFE